MLWIRQLMGWILVGMAAYFIRPVLPDVFKMLLPSGVACLVIATFWVTSWAMQGHGVTWLAYSQRFLEQAAAQKRPVIIDFSADWCAPCRELEEITFHHPEVVRMAGNNFSMIKVDVTLGGNPFHENLLEQYRVKGVPTVVFLDVNGKERADLRLVDFLPPEPFLGRMAQLKQESNP